METSSVAPPQAPDNPGDGGKCGVLFNQHGAARPGPRCPTIGSRRLSPPGSWARCSSSWPCCSGAHPAGGGLDLSVAVLGAGPRRCRRGARAAFLVLRLPVVRLAQDGYRVRLVRGVGVDRAPWTAVREAVTASPSGTPVVVLRRGTGTTTVPVRVLAADREEFVRDPPGAPPARPRPAPCDRPAIARWSPGGRVGARAGASAGSSPVRWCTSADPSFGG